MQKRLLFLLALLMTFMSSAMAQVTTSSLSGTVVADGEEVIGATVDVVHKPSGTHYRAVTNDKGVYTINGMRVGGPYEVTVRCIGFAEQKTGGINLQLGETFNLKTTLSETAKEMQEVMVSAKGSKFSYERTGASTNISNEQMIAMPTVSRNVTDFTRLSPYGGNGMTFQGSDGRTANFTVDGANFNNNFGLSSTLPGGGNPISMEAIEELQVVISPFDVRQTGFIGGALNAITKSGTNTFKGQAYVYHQNENMRGDAVDREFISGSRDKDRTTTYGFSLAGPIIKNKLFFFVNGELIKSPGTGTPWRASENGVGNADAYQSYTTIADMERVQEHVARKYGYNTGSFTSFPADADNKKLLAKITWNINDKNRLDVRYNYTTNSSWVMPNASSMDGGTRSAFSRTSLYSMPFANSMYSLEKNVHSVSLDLNTRLSNSLSNQFLATFSKIDDVRGSNSAEFPFIDIQDGTNTNTQYMSLGYELFSYNNAVHNNIFNLKDELIYTTGRHKITGGVSYEYQMADNQYMRNGTGYYRYSRVDDFINGAAPEVVCLTYGYGGDNDPKARVAFNKAGIYAQDEWNATKNFKLTYGLRLDGLFFDNGDLMTNKAIYDLNYGGRHIDTGKWPNAQVSVSPRVGFNWDILGNKTLKLRGGTGLFSGRLPLVFFTNMPTNSGMIQYQAQINSKNASERGFTMGEFAGGLVTDANGHATIAALKDKLISLGYPANITPEQGTVPSSISAVDNKFKMPQVWKTSLAIDYQLPVSFPFTITAEGIFNKAVNDVTISDWSMTDTRGYARWNGADNRPIYPEVFRIPGNKQAFVLENTHKGYGWSANVSVNMRPWDFLSFMASYTHSVKKELTSMPGSNAESAFTYVPTISGPNNINLHNAYNITPDRFIASLTGHDKSNNHYSLIYETWRGGYNYSYMLQNDMNGDGYAYDALYIPTDKQVQNGEFRFASEDDKTRFMDYVHGDSYLKNHQGEYAEAYSVYSPWVHRVDVSYKHDFKIKAGKSMNTLQLGFDIKNLMNLFNSSWGVSKYMNSKLNEGRILKYEHTDADGYAVFSTPTAVSKDIKTFVPNHAVGQCWYMSIGVKYMFN